MFRKKLLNRYTIRIISTPEIERVQVYIRRVNFSEKEKKHLTLLVHSVISLLLEGHCAIGTFLSVLGKNVVS